MKSALFTIMAAAAIAFASCSSDDDLNASSVPQVVKDEFAQMFPKAGKVEWEKSGQYYVADFYVNTFETDAWFTAAGTWAMTKTDYGMSLTMLPETVVLAFRDSPWCGMILDDAALYQRPDGESFCEIEVDSGESELTIFYDLFGNVITTVPDFEYDITPTTDISAL